jgi:K+-sensing histidine kinase KdpD
MDELVLQFFPFPHLFKGERRAGLQHDWPDRCNACDRQCESSKATGLQLCSYGLNYQRIDSDLLTAGLAVTDYPHLTPARSKMLRRLRGQQVTASEVAAVVAKAGEATEHLVDALRAQQDAVIAEYQTSKTYQRDVVEQLRPQLERQLSQVHDYKQFVQQVIQNLDVVLDRQFPRMPIEEKIELASHEEKAIYWAAMLMDEKLDAALLLLDPSRIHSTVRRFSIHRLVTKYVRIYQRRIDAKNVRLVMGASTAQVDGNPRAFSIIPHALIDNAIKYAPAGTRIDVSFEEDRPGSLLFRVDSWGPRILLHERDRIFDLFYRGDAAKEQGPEGTGVGLAQAQLVAKEIGTVIEVEQDKGASNVKNFRTRFRVRFETAR